MTRLILAFVIGILLGEPALALTPGQEGYARVRSCVMQNNISFCRSVLTPESLPLFNRFVSYNLMPCLPTDFTYESEETSGSRTTLKMRTPAGNGMVYILRLVFFASPKGPKLDLPASFARGLGPDWQDKIQLSEQLYLMMLQNMGNKLTCDMLSNLIKAP